MSTPTVPSGRARRFSGVAVLLAVALSACAPEGARPEWRLALGDGGLIVAPGGSVATTASLTELGADATVELWDAPHGVTGVPLRLGSGAPRAPFVVKAAPDTVPGHYQIRVGARSGGATRSAILALTVAPATLGVSASPAQVAAPRGGVTALTVRVTRADPQRAVTVTAPNLPGGVAVAALTLAPGEDEGTLLVNIAPNAPLGALETRLRASDGEGVASFPLLVTVTEAP